MLLKGTTLAWFAPFLEKKSSLLHDFDGFIKEFQSSFGDTDAVRRAPTSFEDYANDIALLQHILKLIFEEALMDPFRYGLFNDVKDLLLTLHEDLKSLVKAISRAFWCDNWFGGPNIRLCGSITTILGGTSILSHLVWQTNAYSDSYITSLRTIMWSWEIKTSSKLALLILWWSKTYRNIFSTSTIK